MNQSNNYPVVSVIMLTYNHEMFIREAISGVVRQKTTFPIELIIGDDASGDSTQEIIKEMTELYPEVIQPILRTTNIGALKNYRDLIRRSRGKYVAICDGDDYWTDYNKLQKQVVFLENNADYVTCCHPVRQVYEDESQPETILDPLLLSSSEAQSKGYLTIHDLIRINSVASLSTVHRWSLDRNLPEWMEKYSVGDYPLLLLHADKGKVGVIPEIMGVYRKHSAGSWWNHTQTEKQKLDYALLLNDIDQELSLKYHDEFSVVTSYIYDELKQIRIAEYANSKSNIFKKIFRKIRRIIKRISNKLHKNSIAIVELKQLLIEEQEIAKKKEISYKHTILNLQQQVEDAKRRVDRIMQEQGIESEDAYVQAIINLQQQTKEQRNILNLLKDGQECINSEIKMQIETSKLTNAKVSEKLIALCDAVKQLCFATENGKPQDFRGLLSYYFAVCFFNEFYDNYDEIFTDSHEIENWINHTKTDMSMNVQTCLAKISESDMINYQIVYDYLEDIASKDIFVRLIVWKIIGFTKIRILSTEESQRESLVYETIAKSRIDNKERIRDVKFELNCYDLNNVGYDIRCYAIPESIVMDFVRLQYENDFVEISTGDYIVDCGACWGDTALLFAEKCGISGRVFSFEFVPSNMSIFMKNMDMNSRLASIITLVPYAVSDSNYDTIEFVDDGTATSIAIDKQEVKSERLTAETITIDEYMYKERICKVDFIKMDIEGAEMSALIGCKETILKHHPKLAISIYHKAEDMWQIPQYIHSLCPDYKFYIKHNTRSALETILLAH